MAIETCRRAREVLYCSYMNQSIYEMVTSWSTYMKYQLKQPSEPLKSLPATNCLWEQVRMDIYEFGKENCLVIYDYYSVTNFALELGKFVA